MKIHKIGVVPGWILLCWNAGMADQMFCFDGPTNPHLHKNTTGMMNLKNECDILINFLN